MPALSWNPGDVLLGKYRIERILGEGGMGVVVAAMHTTLGERVAIKFLQPAVLANPTIVARFLQEARAAVRIKSEHVAKVSDAGTLESGEPFMVMEHLDGSDLSNTIAARGPLSFAAAAEYVVQACDALAHAHILGIVHRDIKPANLFLTTNADGSPCVKLLDFGISKACLAAGIDQPSLTHSAVTLGTPMYMSPEQMRSSRDVDARTDIWSLGATLHELLAGQPPFFGQSLTEVCAHVLTSEPPPLRVARPDVPPAIEEIVLRCLEKDPARRFQNVADLADALAPFCSPQGRLTARRTASILGVVPAPHHGEGGTSDTLPELPRAPSARVRVTPAPPLPQSTAPLPVVPSSPPASPASPSQPPGSLPMTSIQPAPARSALPVVVAVALVALASGAFFAFRSGASPVVAAPSVGSPAPAAPSSAPAPPAVSLASASPVATGPTAAPSASAVVPSPTRPVARPVSSANRGEKDVGF